MAELVDAVISGGGPVGATIALGLARQGRQVALVEPVQPRSAPGALGMDPRALALSPLSRQLLDSVGIWQSLKPCPFRAMRVWEERGSAELCFDASRTQREALGWIEGFGALTEALWQALAAHPRVRLLQGTRLTAVQAGAKAVQLGLVGPASGSRLATRLRTERRLATRCLIAADGASSPIRKKLSTRVHVRETGHTALTSVVRLEGRHDDTAWQRFLLSGPLALLPGPEPDLAALIWSQPPSMAKQHMAEREKDFCASVTAASEARLGAIIATDQRHAFPLQQLVASTCNPHPRVLLTGDAARVLHPMAGLGLNLGLEDAAGLLRRAEAAGADLGRNGIWRQFARRRQARSWSLVLLLSALKALYGAGGPEVTWARNLGVRQVNRLTLVNRLFVEEAAGLGPVARFLRQGRR